MTGEGAMIAGILFDAGDTLVRPISGQWFPGPRFREIVEAHDIHSLAWDRLPQAFQETRIFSDTRNLVATEAEEFEFFLGWYEIFLKCLGLVHPDERLLHDLANAWIHEVQIAPFPEAISTLALLHKRELSLGILSNFWPSLERQFRLIGLRDYFDAFVISMQVGYQKPDARIFQIAVEQMGIEPTKLLFVDDSPMNVRAACKLGLRGILISRDDQLAAGDIPCITTLLAIDTYL